MTCAFHASSRGRHRRRHAFTLVELLVVIGIIALLISILLPSLNRARAAAAATACLSNMRQLGQAQVFFNNDHDQWTVKEWQNSGPYWDPAMAPANPAHRAHSPNEWQWENPAWGWDSVLLTYTGTKEVFRCPGDGNDGDDQNGTRGWPNDGNAALWGDRDPTMDNIPASYRFNTSNNSWIPYSYKITKIVNPTKSITIYEGAEDTNTHGSNTYFPGPDRNLHPLYPRQVASFRHGSDQGNGNPRDPDFYNKRRLNYLFHDGHAEAITWEETWRPLEVAVEASNGQPQDVTMWRQVYEPNPFGTIMPNVAPNGGVWDE